MEWIPLVHSLWQAASRHPDNARMDHVMRRVLRRAGVEPTPFGEGDRKTAAPGTYRPVGKTCPPACPYLGHGCYAQTHHVGRHQARATDERVAAVGAAAAAMVWAAVTGRVARLHVSGDFGSPEVDTEYVAAVALVARTVRKLRGGDGPVAWAYTHHPLGPWATVLGEAGVSLRQSDYLGVAGAVVVADRASAQALRSPTTKVAVCPAQLRDVTCQDCRLCWTRHDVTIAFIAHGSGRSAVLNRIGG